MLPHFPAGAGTQETGSKRKGKHRKEEFLKRKCNQDPNMTNSSCTGTISTQHLVLTTPLCFDDNFEHDEQNNAVCRVNNVANSFERR